MSRNQAYREAEQKIKEVRKSRTKELDLGGKLADSPKITELPESLGELTHLQSLKLSNNQLTALPQWVGRLTQLRSLDLSSNQLTMLPESLARLMQLESLDLSYNQFAMPPEPLSELAQLRELNFHSNGLTALPQWMGRLTQLRSVNLSDNHLTTLSECLGQLRELQKIFLAKNQLTALPESVGQLTRLELIDLSNNLMTRFPDSLVMLTQLQSMDLAGNELKLLPEPLTGLTGLQSLDLSDNKLPALPESLGQLRELHVLDLRGNQLTALPESLGQLRQLKKLDLSYNEIGDLPESLAQLENLDELNLRHNPLGQLPESLRGLRTLKSLYLHDCGLSSIPHWIGELISLQFIGMGGNKLSELPDSFAQLQSMTTIFLGYKVGDGNPIDHLPNCLSKLKNLKNLFALKCKLTDLPNWVLELESLKDLDLEGNPLNPELAAAYEEGFDAVKRYLRAKAGPQVVLNEAKLILIGEGEVGKSCLLGALRDDPWEESRPTTHGIEIKPVKVTDPDSGTEITLNGWDFGGQRVYRPTHQLFFSAPAIYLVVWKPREGPQQGFVKEWINLVKHRAPDAKMLVVATHGGPKERQPDIDRQEIWDRFGKEMVLDFFLVESKPGKRRERKGIADLKIAIARAAASLPEMGRKVPRRWEEARQALKKTGAAYLPLEQALKLCRDCKMDDDEAKDFVRISHRQGHLIHYEHDPLLQDVVVLKPDWLSTAISFVLDDKQTRDAHGLVTLARLGQLWNDSARPQESRYDARLHPLFLRLMERFDLSYKVAIPSEPENAIGFWQGVRGHFSALKKATDGLSGINYTSLIAQLVPDIRPLDHDLNVVWPVDPAHGDEQQIQICRIVEAKSGQSTAAEGLFFQLIVRLHKYSLGRVSHKDSLHWQRGLVLEDDYGARALLEHVGNDVRITVRSPYPERFLAALTYEVKWLVENFWAGLRCEVMVPCIEPCGRNARGTGLFEVEKLMESKRRRRPDYPCPVCDEWQSIEKLLHNAPAAQPSPLDELLINSAETVRMLTEVRLQMGGRHAEVMGRFDKLDASSKQLVTKVEAAYTGLMRTFLDEAKDGPRLFSFEPADRNFFDRPTWISEKFRITLWCEHSRLPLPALNAKGDKRGVYELNLPREWVVKAAPYLKVLTGTLSLVVPVAASATKLVLEEATYKGIEKQLDLGQKSLDSLLKGGEKVGSWLSEGDALELERGVAISAQGGVLRQLHAWLKEKDPGFGGLVRVQNRRQEFLWVHSKFQTEY
jgi:Leucine-rich repeat (LRR) protein